MKGLLKTVGVTEMCREGVPWDRRDMRGDLKGDSGVSPLRI